MWAHLLHGFLTHLVHKGRLRLIYPDGTERVYSGSTDGADVAVTLHDPALPRKIVMSPDMAVGEGYVDGRLTIENDDLYGLLTLAIGNVADAPGGDAPWHRQIEALRRVGRWVTQFNPASRARTNVAHHYDLSGELYDLFLDADRQYSCAYFSDPAMTLDEAQEAKKHHIAAKLLVEPGMRVLDIGCGWGGMGLTLARDYGAEVLGVTLSSEQHAIANRRAAEAGLQDRAKFELIDYREVEGRFDRIVSIGMFEHVGVPHYHTYFNKIEELLDPQGVALVHCIGRARPPGTTSPWIAKYIFPGGYVPALSEMVRVIEDTDLYTTDVEVLRLHYAETLKHWHDRFVANIDKARDLYDEKFCRMWRYYLIACELTFRLNRQVVFQVQLSPTKDAVPLTRDYLYPPDRGMERQAAE
ncbi:class I SAM-dependent methyltransferase [Roseovarius spongiae]|uniref:Class I SAM-dependent methyltransferase n=1 Tax=Roseovarius spongiae TaxID=2320272 RepID=A0A3A8AW34_9RHOB|nr:cyclopropane-fatty-acyl-phospholipid synthase family protein [Roseovarius spongiae]RKF16513.1 class I SAM-dependent methyltransferase [Roseovarius spongiae]